MKSRIRTHKKSTREQTPDFSSAPAQPMFQSRPFVVQTQADRESQQPDLKTSLMRAERYGHHLSQMQPTGVPTHQAVQLKRTDGSSNVEIIQMAKRKSTASGTGSPAPKRPRNSYSIGQHGAKKREQDRLTKEYGFKVSGKTHESEHPVGFEPLNQTSGLKRNTPGRASDLENKAPAYQEMEPLHSAHIGTGTRNSRDASGFNSTEYRDTQRSLIESGDISSAVQINQLGYAFNPAFRQGMNTAKGRAATDSYQTMVKNMNSVTYAQGSQDINVPVDRRQQQEMLLGREAALTGKWPTFAVNRANMEAQAPTLLAGQQQRQKNLENKRTIAAQSPAVIAKEETSQ